MVSDISCLCGGLPAHMLPLLLDAGNAAIGQGNKDCRGLGLGRAVLKDCRGAARR
jgi:hypothetical protein